MDDVCAQWIKKYGRLMLHVGPFKISMARACPETMSRYNKPIYLFIYFQYDKTICFSDSYLAKKGVTILSQDNIEALMQVLPVLIDEMPHLEEILAKRSKLT